MKIKITIIEIDIPDKQEQPAYKPESPKPFFDLLCREIERIFDPKLFTEATPHGPFLAQ